LTSFHEGHSARAVEISMVLSHKDARIVSELPGVAFEPQVVHPPRPDAHQERSPAAPPEVLFVGAFGRAVNQDAVMWLLTEVWPRVTRFRPDARLVLAGSDPNGFAALAAADRPDVRATGFVEDLSPYYSRASVVVVPLRVGAGVKFKTIDALLHGVPVVTTSIGSEGIDGSELFWVEADGAESMGEGIISALADPSARRQAGRAAEQVRDRYSRGAFANSVRRIYGKLT
jgi:glycosyltransferase involved in cell wall biosynthesis